VGIYYSLSALNSFAWDKCNNKIWECIKSENYILEGICSLLVTADVVPNSPILVILMMEALSYSETSVLTRATLSNIPKFGILNSYRRENLKFYICFLLSISVSSTFLLILFLPTPKL
jgi:hypothetical protein